MSQTVNWAPLVYGERAPELDDPAEVFHEASKLSPAVVDHRVRGGSLLQRDEHLRASVVRAVKRHPQARRVPLPQPRLGGLSLSAALRQRESQREFGSRPLKTVEVATLLHAAYGVTHRLVTADHPLRAAPSGGALYPLEIYPIISRVEALPPGLYHYDPLRGALEALREADPRPELEGLTVYPHLLVPASIVFVMTAMFWRSRFKYGLRGYRFALLEAGHVGQNLLLAAAALGLAAVPIGGFYDRRVDGFLGVDGVNESAVYAVSVGPRVAR